jgi:hypothetical protein
LLRTRYLILTVLTTIALLSGLVYLYFVDPAEGHSVLVCPFHYCTGFYCPGCGSSRAVHQLLHGHALAALQLNPLTVIMLPALLIVFVINSIAACRGSTAHWHRPRWMPAHWPWALVVLIIGFGVLRNIPYWPFTILAPH